VNAVRAAADRLLALAGAAATHHTVIGAHGGAIHHIESGSGAAVVLVHGGGGGGANWFRLIGPLATRHRVLALDLPGFGESTGVPEHGPLGSQAGAVLSDWLERVDAPPADVIGTSFGALAAFRFAQEHPGRVRRLVLIDAVGLGAAVPWAVRLAAMPALGRLLLRPSRAGGRVLFDRLLTGGRRPLPPPLREALLDYLWQCDVAGAATQLRASLPRFAGARGQREVIAAEELRSFRTPTLVLWGGRDRFVPVGHGRRAAAEMPGARLVVIPEAGHSPNWETPGEVLGAVGAFLGDGHLPAA
jgi:4,5:9,10-diseco-3-hydroxy-5,9,17-trioxoandrosta-1(10),2-diene-4-oate hydrolase